jgi:hypothetical protein
LSGTCPPRFSTPEEKRHTLTVRTPEGKILVYAVSSAILGGDSGDNGGKPEIVRENVSSHEEKPMGTRGNSLTGEEECLQCPRFPDYEPGQEKVNDYTCSLGVPSAPTQNGKVRNNFPL